MKRLLSNRVLAGLALAAVAVQPLAAATMPATGKVCLRLGDIKDSENAKDGSSITFTTRDGKVWRNDIPGGCPGLRYNGYVWVVHSPEEICDGEMSFRVLQSGETCQIGKFTQVTPAPKS